MNENRAAKPINQCLLLFLESLLAESDLSLHLLAGPAPARNIRAIESLAGVQPAKALEAIA